MHRIIIEEPYEFVPPHRGRLWPALLRRYVPRYLRKAFGVVEVEVRGADRLADSVRAGHGVLLAPNHCRHCDAVVLCELGRRAGTHFYTVASWHLFKQNAWTTFLLRRMGAFSIYREGMDRAAVSCSIAVLEAADRPLVIFPEGVVSRANDMVGSLMAGTAFIARAAARKRAKASPGGQVVMHPVAIKYSCLTDVRPSIALVLDDIEQRLSWEPRRKLALLERLRKVGGALLALKELEYLGTTQAGDLHDRKSRLIDHLLGPLEEEWLEGRQDGGAVARVKKLRSTLLPDLVEGDLSEGERERRWQQLAAMYLAQQLWFYPADYLEEEISMERLLETVERLEEGLTDKARIHGLLKATVQVGEAIAVEPQRARGVDADPLLLRLDEELSAMLTRLASELNHPLSETAETGKRR